ncbi:hypothetical protein PoB_001959200 [Plakobranchus ocellatus]|uniref:Secreted protein n=1 Tax=Plakobranchus ocellatus TaxID=259542 RepID=A0AAV3ZF29_9GAST|nr:hypothetical protein PoB_001959200 [Plakobranchus ocellatus]
MLIAIVHFSFLHAPVLVRLYGRDPFRITKWFGFWYSQSITKWFQAFRPSVRPGHRWQGSNPRQKGLCRSQGGSTSHCATDAPITNWSEQCSKPGALGIQCVSIYQCASRKKKDEERKKFFGEKGKKGRSRGGHR